SLCSIPPCCPSLCSIPPCCPSLCSIPPCCPSLCSIPPCCPFLCSIPPCCPSLCSIPPCCPSLCSFQPCCPSLCSIPPCCPSLCSIPPCCPSLCSFQPCCPSLCSIPPCCPFLIPTHGCWMGLRGPRTPQPLCSLLPLPSLIQTSPDPSGPAPGRFSLLNPGKTNSAQTRAVLGGKRNLGCHRVPTNPQHYPVCRGQGPSSRRNSIVHKGNRKIRPGHPFPAGRDGGSHPARPPGVQWGKSSPC
uniref:Uncharacterized protein n=1 Tax=Corvus moneduloides TaxID=1196302 RepID=A0A8U7P612_CORMO